jgi:hypothetical protein
LSSDTPQPLGTAAAGSSASASRSDHVHPIQLATTTTAGSISVGTGLTVAGGALSANVVSVQGRTGTVTITTTELSAVTSIVAGIASSNAVTNIVYMTSAAYTALGTKNASTLYIISG